MADSEEDGDSDRFESADEHFSDENEPETEKSVSRDVSIVDQKESSAGAVGYRKRPERIRTSPKRSPSFESTTKKNNGSKDFGKPDELLHDLTSNISKNINKSLDSIQQTSSSIKDMVFRSLPNPKPSDSVHDKLDLFEDDSSAETETATYRLPTTESEHSGKVLADDEKFVPPVEETRAFEETRPETVDELVTDDETSKGVNVEREEQPDPKASSEPQEENFGNTEGWDDFDIDDGEFAECGDGADRRSNEDPSKDGHSGKSGWGLPKWGVGTFLDTASAVTRGISTVLETGLGVPDPETLAKAQKSEEGFPKEEEKEREQEDKNPAFPTFGFTDLVAGVTSKIVERTKVQEIGSRVITGGLDTLENIGKKTMQVLQEGDPGLKKKRALLLGNEKPVLSQMLREAKERTESEDRKLKEKQARRNLRFETLFDDFQGLVHLEALEMLSKQCELKLDQLRISTPNDQRQDLEGILEEVKELCDIEESDYETDPSTSLRFKTILTEAVEPLKNEISVRRIIEIHEESEEWLKKEGTETREKTYQKAMSTMAELTAAAVHQFHKAGELLAVKERRKTVEEAEALIRFAKLLCSEVGFLSGKFFKALKESKDPEDADTRSENIVSESENAISYIKQAFNLLVPVVQLGAT